MYPEMSISEVRWVVRAESEKEINVENKVMFRFTGWSGQETGLFLLWRLGTQKGWDESPLAMRRSGIPAVPWTLQIHFEISLTIIKHEFALFSQRTMEALWNTLKSANGSKNIVGRQHSEKPRVWWTLDPSNMASWSLKLSRPYRSNMISQILKVAHCRLFQNMSVCTNASAFQSAYSQISGPV